MNKRSIFSMSDLSTQQINNIINDALMFLNSKKDWQLPSNRLVANLFFEPSTRTHYSFVSAELQLGMKVVNFNEQASSTKKGETLYDTVKTFEAIGYDLLVIRHSQDEYFKELDNIKIPIINAGDGSTNHPSQCLLDLMTIYQEFETFSDLNIVIVGDVLHSRVAHSNIETLKRLGANVKVSGPKNLMDDLNDYIDLDEACEWADVVMLLRVQHERHAETLQLSGEDYLEKYGLSKTRYSLLKDSAIVMHPAPVNRGVEIDTDLVESPKSRIFKQMENGVYIRKALIKYALNIEVN